MLDHVDVRTPMGATISLSLEEPGNGYIIQDISGLDPVKATLVSSSFAQIDGEYYQSSRRDSRNITIKLGLEPDYSTKSVQDLRRELYAYFMPKSEVELTFWMDTGNPVRISGRVETFESPLFAQEPEVDISIMCFDPDFVDLLSTMLTGQSSTSASMTWYDYPGTVDTGVVFRLFVGGDGLQQFSIFHMNGDGVQKSFDFQVPLQGADLLEVNSNIGEKAVTLIRGSVRSSLLYGMTPQSAWPLFTPGGNALVVYTPTTPNPLSWSLEYITRYGGL